MDLAPLNDWIFKKMYRLKYKVRPKIIGWWQDNVYTRFCPYNVVRAQKLTRHWHDRVDVMYHVAFQCLVDYVELEQPYIDWTSKYKVKRLNDISAMRAYVAGNYGPDVKLELWGQTEEDAREYNAHRFKVDTEILDLYEWYATDRWDTDKYPIDAWDAVEETIDANFARLLKVRRALWT